MFKMKKILFVVISLLYGVAYSQVCADEDTVRSNAVSLITATTVRVNGTVSHFSGAPTSLQLRYVRVGQTDTATSSSVPTTALRNLTGLQAATQYYYYYKTICGSGSVSQTIGAYTFTTLANTVLYAPERPTVFNHLKVDSSFIVPEGDTVVGREPSTRAQIRYKTSDNTFYGYYTDCTCWRALAIDSSGIIGLLDGKVDSVTVSGDSLFYWKVGVSYGYILPSVATVWHTTGNTGIDTSTDFIGTTDNVDFPIKTNDVRRFTVNTSGAWGIGATPDYGTSGYVYKSAGSAAAPTWSAHTFQDAITAGSTLTAGNVINGGGFDFEFGTMGNFTIESTNGSIEFTDLLQNSIDLSGSIGINIKPYTGLLIIDTLINNTAQNQLIGWTSTAGADRGEVGYVTLSGLTLSGGVLTNPNPTPGANTALSNLASVAINTSLISDANNTDDLGSNTIGWRYGYISSGIGIGSGFTTPSAALDIRAADLFLTSSSVDQRFIIGESLVSATECYAISWNRTDNQLVFNEGGAAVSMRLEGDNNANLFFADATNDRIGIGDATPASLFTVGSGDLFQVNTSGDMVKIKNVTYSWPAANAAGALINDGSGNLSWSVPYWALTGTSTLTGNVTIDGTGGPYNVSIRSNSGGVLRVADNVTTIGDPDVAQTGALMKIDAVNNIAYILSSAIAGASVGDALTVGNTTTGEITVAPNLAFNLKKEGTMIYAKNGRVFAEDNSGNKTQLSPHDDKGNWIYHSTNKEGITTEINMIRLAELLEKVTGEKLIYKTKN